MLQYKETVRGLLSIVSQTIKEIAHCWAIHETVLFYGKQQSYYSKLILYAYLKLTLQN